MGPQFRIAVVVVVVAAAGVTAVVHCEYTVLFSCNMRSLLAFRTR